MADQDNGEHAIEAAHGEKMIEIRLRFWTNDIAPEKGQVRPRHAWTQGVVIMQRNQTHGIEPQKYRHFHSLLEIGAVIEEVLVDHDVCLHPSPRMAKYLP